MRIIPIGVFSFCTIMHFSLPPAVFSNPNKNELATVMSSSNNVVRVRELVFDSKGNAQFNSYRIQPAKGSYSPQNAQAASLHFTKDVKQQDIAFKTEKSKSNTLPLKPTSARVFKFTPARGEYYVQIGAFKKVKNAEKLQKRLSFSQTSQVHKMGVGAGAIYKVMLGPEPTRTRAEGIKRRIIGQKGLSAAFVVAQ